MNDLSNDEVLHIKKDTEYLQFRRLLEYPELVHCYTLSTNDFDVAGNDTMENKKESVLNNYAKLAHELDIDYNHIIRPYQTHTDIIKRVDKVPSKIEIFSKEYLDVDGLITDKTGITFSLGFADCTPLFLYDPVKKIIGDIHSGWKGTLKKIGKKAVLKMVEEYGCNPKDMICCIGPSIRKCHFEVSRDVEELFYNEFLYTNKIDDIITKENIDDEKYHIDTVLINKLILQEAGIDAKNIIDSKICTVCNSSLMHSFRVDKERAGRNTAIMGLR